MMSLASAMLLLLVPVVVYGEIDWRTEPTWGFQVVLGRDIELECNDTNAKLESGDTLKWRTPQDWELLGSSGHNDDKYELIDKNSVSGMVLKIKKVAVEDHGVYFCHVTRGGVEYRRITRALNLYEPAYGSNIDRYRNDIMIGGIAAAIFFVPVVGACLIQKFRYQSDEERNQKRELREQAKQVRAKYLQQLENNEEEVDSKVPQTDDGYTNTAFDQASTRL